MTTFDTSKVLEILKNGCKARKENCEGCIASGTKKFRHACFLLVLMDTTTGKKVKLSPATKTDDVRTAIGGALIKSGLL